MFYSVWVALAINCDNIIKFGHIKDVIRVYKLTVVFESELIFFALNWFAESIKYPQYLMQKLVPLVSYDINIPLVLFLLNFTSFLLKNSQLDCHLQFVDIVVFSHIKQEIIQKVNDL